MTGIADDRAYALQLARRYFDERNVEIGTIVETFGNSTDPLIRRLVDLMVREPARSGKFITVSQRDYETNYIVSYKGFAFFTVSKDELRLPPSAEVISADSMYVPG